MKARFAVALAALLLLVATPALAETLTNQQIIRLTEAGVGADAIVAKIRASATEFDVSTDAMVALKHDAVPDAVIAAMVASAAGGGAPGSVLDQSDSADPSAPHAPGVYLLERAPAAGMQRLDPTVADDTKTSSVFGWFFSQGLAPLKVTTVLDNPTAHFRADSGRPTFYFYFNQPGTGLYRKGMGWMRLDAPTPDQFTLLRFDVVGGNRQAITEQVGGALTPPKGPATQVPFSATQVAPGVFAVTPDADLGAGEYAFMVTPDSDSDDGAQSRYFDFSTVPADPQTANTAQ
jgi:hypothetical protein